MEKIKNLLKPGKSQDDETLYGTGQSTGTHTAGLTGEGSHLGGQTNTPQTTNPTSTSGQYSSGIENTGLGATSGQTTQPGNHSGQGSHLAGATSGQTSTLPSHTSGVTTTTTTQTHTGQSHLGRDVGLAGTAATGVGLAEHHHQGHQSGHGSSTTESGLGNHQSTGTSSGSTSGPHSSNLANRADPRVDSDNSRYPIQSGAEPTAQKSGLGNAQIGGSTGPSALSGLSEGSAASNTLSGPTHSSGAAASSQHMPGEWVDEADSSRYAGIDSSRINTTSGNHLGRETAVLGGAGLAGSGAHGHRDNEQGLGSATGTSNLAQTSHAGSVPSYDQGSSTKTDHHLGRDAAVLGGAAALGSGIHSHERGHDSGLSSTQYTGAQGPHNTATANLLDPQVNTRATGHEDALHHSPTQGGGAEEADQHHGGKLTGSAAALGRGPTHQGQYQTERGTGVGGISSTGPAPHTAGPHQKDLANVLDPRVNPNNAAGQGAQAVPQTSSHSTADSSGHHYGRDAAIGAGTLGAAGLATNQHSRHQAGSDIGNSNTSNIHQPSTGTSGLSSGPAATTAGPHKSDLLNKADPRVIANPTIAQGNPHAQSVLEQSDRSHASTGGYAAQSSVPHDKDYNYGRDAALAGGATSAFVGSRHHDQSGATDTTRTGQHGVAATSQDPYSSSATQRSTVDPNDRSKDHHYGRDAAIAGGVAGVGGAAYEADQHKHEKELAKAQREAEKEREHDLKQAEKDHKHDAKRAEKHAEKDHKKDLKEAEKEEKHQEKKKHGFLSFLHRDKSKKYSAEEEADFDRQEREHNASHSHNAALGGAAVAGAGAGAYAAEKHHNADTNKSLPTAPGNHGIGTGAGTQNALAGNTSSSTHDSATHGTPLPLKPAGNDIGDKLHGVERNRGVTGASGFPDQPGFGHGHHSVSEATTDQHGNPIGSGTSGTTGAGYGSQQTGREFPLGQSKHDSGYTDKTSPTHATSQHHTGRDAAALGGAGLVGEHEYRKHDTTSGQHSGLTGSQGQPGLSGNLSGLSGNHSGLSGNQSGLTGNQSGLTGNQSGLSGNQSGLSGNQSGLSGNQSALTGNQSGLSGNQSGLSGNQSGLSGNQASGGYQSVLDPARQTGTSTNQQDYRQHDTTSGYQTGREASGLGSSTGHQDYRQNTTAGYQSGNQTSGLGSSTGQYQDSSASSGLTGSKTSDLSGRNRLHKDPPSSHPAAQGYSGSGDKGAHVPASGAERERVVEQGRDNLDRDTGVANAPPANTSTNY